MMRKIPLPKTDENSKEQEVLEEKYVKIVVKRDVYFFSMLDWIPFSRNLYSNSVVENKAVC